MELAIFGAIALGALGFFLRTLASEFGAIRATQEAFRLCLHHAAEDNGNFPYEARGVAGFLQIGVPSVSLQSWDISAGDAHRSCFVEWGSHLTMSNAPGPCTSGKGEPFYFGYSGGSSTSWKQSEGPCVATALDRESTITNVSQSVIEQRTGGGTTTGTVTPTGCATLSTEMAGGGAVAHTICYGGTVTGSTTAP